MNMFTNSEYVVGESLAADFTTTAISTNRYARIMVQASCTGKSSTSGSILIQGTSLVDDTGQPTDWAQVATFNTSTSGAAVFTSGIVQICHKFIRLSYGKGSETTGTVNIAVTLQDVATSA